MSRRIARKILLLGWDAADWKVITPLLEKGLMPNLEKLIREGVMGNLATLAPILSPMLWTSIATGKTADKHGILGFVEPRPDGKGIRPVTSTSRQCKAIWNILSERGLRASVVGWFAGHPAERIQGVSVSNLVQKAQGKSFDEWELPDGGVQPESMRELIRDLRVHPSEITAEQIVHFVPRATEVDQDKDRRLVTLAKLLAEFSTIHAIGTHLAETESWDLLGVYYDTIDHFGHAFMQYRPPLMDGISEKDSGIYGDAVDYCYRLHDLAIGRYRQLVGEDATIVIVSDHGFHSDHLRPPIRTTIDGEGFTHWHRDYGILVAAGPGIRKDERVYGATLLDVTPTLLTMLGLPVAMDMDGKTLVQIFEEDPVVDRIPTWEPDTEARTPTAGNDEGREDPWAAEEAMRQLVALGYVEGAEGDQRRAVENATAQRHSNLATVHAAKGEYDRAIEELRKMLEYRKFLPALLRMAECHMRLGNREDARQILDEVLDEQPNSPHGNLLKGYLYYLDGDDEKSLEHLGRVERVQPRLPRLKLYLGRVHLRQRRWGDAERAFRAALEIDSESARAFHGLGIVLHQQKRYEEAVEAGMRSVALLHHQPSAHFSLARSLAACGQLQWAIQALHTSLELRPNQQRAHEELARLYRVQGARARADLHRATAARLAEGQHGRKGSIPENEGDPA